MEDYIVKECITFCSMYLDEMETVFDRPERNEDRGECCKSLMVFTDPARPISLVSRSFNLSQEFIDSAHWFLLFNSPEVEPYLE